MCRRFPIASRIELCLPCAIIINLSLFGGDDGLDFYRSITEKYRHNLKPGGYLCYEFGEDQGDDVCDILAANGFTVRQRVKDFCGTERAVIAQYCVEE